MPPECLHGQRDIGGDGVGQGQVEHQVVNIGAAPQLLNICHMTPGPRSLSRLPHFTKCLIYSNLIQKICVFYSWNRTLHSGKRFWVLISFSRNMQRISEIKSQMNNVPCAMTVFARPPGPMCLGLYQLKKFSLRAYTHMLTLNKANLSSWLCRRWQSPRLCSQTPQTLPSRGSQCRWTPSSLLSLSFFCPSMSDSETDCCLRCDCLATRYLYFLPGPASG